MTQSSVIPQLALRDHLFLSTGDVSFSIRYTVSLIQEFVQPNDWSQLAMCGLASTWTFAGGHARASSVNAPKFNDTQSPHCLLFPRLAPGLTQYTLTWWDHSHRPEDSHISSHVWTDSHDGQRPSLSLASRQKR